MNVLIATDGTSAATRAIREALRLLPLGTVRITALAVSPDDTSFRPAISLGGGPVGEVLYPELLMHAREQPLRGLYELHELLSRLAVPATYLRRQGDPAEEIMRTAAERHADVIVLAPHHRGAVARLLSGSVSEAVFHRWSGSLLIVQPPSSPLSRPRRRASRPVG